MMSLKMVSKNVIAVSLLFFILIVDTVGSPVANTEANNTSNISHTIGDKFDHGVNLASWRWGIYGDIIMFCLTILLAALFKLIFHHAHFLSKRVPESVSQSLKFACLGVPGSNLVAVQFIDSVKHGRRLIEN